MAKYNNGKHPSPVYPAAPQRRVSSDREFRWPEYRFILHLVPELGIMNSKISEAWGLSKITSESVWLMSVESMSYLWASVRSG